MKTFDISREKFMKKVMFIVILSAFVAGCSDGDVVSSSEVMMSPNNKISPEEAAQTIKGRGPVKIHLKKQDGSWFDMQFSDAQPVVQGDIVTIFAGEKICLEFDAGLKGPENFRQVQSVKVPQRTLILNLFQDTKAADGSGMMFSIGNKHERSIKYDLGMMVLESEDVYKTSSCPIYEKIDVFEMWPHPIFQLVMTNFRWAKPDEGCY